MVNDKIYELAKQAGMIEFETIPGSKAVSPSYESIVKSRKFAEMVIRECYNVALRDGDGDYMPHDILTHFGVEE